MAKTPAWKKFQDNVQDYLVSLVEHNPVVVERLYDTHSAGNFLPAQPADFRLLIRGITVLLEVKHSVKHRSLYSCFSSAVSDDQLAGHRMYLRAGGFCYFLFGSEIKKGDWNIELWPSQELRQCRLEGRRLKKEYIIKQGSSIKEVLSNICVSTRHERTFIF